MESHSCEKNRGEGASGALPLPNPVIGALPEIDNEDDSLRCRHIDALGRRCRMFVATPDLTSSDAPAALQDQAAEFCPHHAQRLLRRHRATEATAAELLASVSDFNDPPSVNRFLGNLLKLVAVKRVPRRDAIALAYISQLILNSQAAQDRRELMRLQIADLDAQRQKSLPTRVIWDLPVRRKPPEQEASAEKPSPSEAPPSSPAPASPAASAPARTDSHAAQRLPESAPPPSDRPALSDCPPTQSPVATAPSAPTTPASGAAVPAATPGLPKPIPGFTLAREGHTTDWYAPASWNKPARRRYPSSRWY